MPRLAANLSLQFNEVPFLERFGAAADAGFRGVEYLFPYAEQAADIAERLEARGLTQVLFNLPPGNWEGGDRGLAGLPERESEFSDSIGRAIEYANALGCRRLHAMAGIVPDGQPSQANYDCLAQNVQRLADAAAQSGIDIMVEPINSRVDMPGYLLDTTAKAVALMDAVDRPNVRLQFDIYHVQIMEGDLARSIERLLPRIGHVQLADNPGRHEPGTGEINYAWLLEKIDALGYDGWIGCEYRPADSTVDGLEWAESYLGR